MMVGITIEQFLFVDKEILIALDNDFADMINLNVLNELDFYEKVSLLYYYNHILNEDVMKE